MGGVGFTDRLMLLEGAAADLYIVVIADGIVRRGRGEGGGGSAWECHTGKLWRWRLGWWCVGGERCVWVR